MRLGTYIRRHLEDMLYALSPSRNWEDLKALARSYVDDFFAAPEFDYPERELKDLDRS